MNRPHLIVLRALLSVLLFAAAATVLAQEPPTPRTIQQELWLDVAVDAQGHGRLAGKNRGLSQDLRARLEKLVASLDFVPATVGDTPVASRSGLVLVLEFKDSDAPAAEVWLRSVDVAPLIKRRVMPHYPNNAVRTGRGGEVLVAVTVTRRGRVRDPRVLFSSGGSDLARAAVEAIRAWHFEPSTVAGKPVETGIQVPFVFTTARKGDPVPELTLPASPSSIAAAGQLRLREPVAARPL